MAFRDLINRLLPWRSSPTGTGESRLASLIGAAKLAPSAMERTPLPGQSKGASRLQRLIDALKSEKAKPEPKPLELPPDEFPTEPAEAEVPWAQEAPEEAPIPFGEGPKDAIEAFLDFGEWLPMASSNVAGAQYEPDAERLTIEFKDGSFYQYQMVSRTEAESFARAGSKGGWVWDNLRVRGKIYAYRKPYIFLSGPSAPNRDWMRSQQSRKRHGAIGPAGEPFKGYRP